jgi:hypothetical protein
MGQTIVVGLPELRVPSQNMPVRSAPPRANIARDKATERVANSWCYPGPCRGDLTSSSFVSESRLRGFLHALSCELASSHPGSHDREYSGTTRETTWHRFTPWGHLPLSGPIERHVCPCWLTPAHSDSTQILTQHHDAQSQTISQFSNVETTPTRRVPSQFSPSGLSKHQRTESVRMPHIFLTTRIDSGAS